MAEPISCPVQGYKNPWCKLRDSPKIGVGIEKLSDSINWTKKSIYKSVGFQFIASSEMEENLYWAVHWWIVKNSFLMTLDHFLSFGV